MKQTIKFALAGCGHIGKRYKDVIDANPEAEIVAFCDVSPREKLSFSFEQPLYATLEELLKSEDEIDVVCIATPNGLHATQALEVLNAGHHVIIEKPIALKRTDAEKVIHTALTKNRHVFGVMQNRYSPPSQWIKKVVSDGVLGKIYLVQVNCYWNRDERYYDKDNWHGNAGLDGGTLFTQFSHFIDTLYWLFGDIENLQTRLRDFNHQELTEFEDTGIISFDFTQGGSGILCYSTSVWDTNFESSLTIIAENGTIKIGGQYMNKVEYCHVKNYEMNQADLISPERPDKSTISTTNHGLLIQNVIDVLKGTDSITTNALEGLKVVDIIERIYNNH